MQEQEIWKDIVGYEGLYQVSNLGRVKSLKKYKPLIMKQNLDNTGYYMVGIRKDNKQTRYLVHRLVAQAFVLNNNNKPHVNHINGVKTDNRSINLEWVTHSENVKHAYDMSLTSKRCGENNTFHKLTEKDVIFIRQNFKPYSKDFNRKTFAKMFNISVANIKSILAGRLWKHLL